MQLANDNKHVKELVKLALALGLPGRFVGRLVKASRTLTNPDIRLPLPDNFPPVIPSIEGRKLLSVIEQELARHGKTLETVGTLTVAYPHKNPLKYRKHHDAAAHYASIIERKITKAYAARCAKDKNDVRLPFKIQFADAICEEKRLERSENQSAIHALTGRQIYSVCENAREKPIDFLDPAQQGRPHFFIILDWMVEQGTTVANLASFIKHNGGEVLAITSGENKEEVNLRPAARTTACELAQLSGKFAAATSKETLYHIGRLLQKSAKRMGHNDTDINDVLDRVEKAINRHGSSLFSLTAGEADRLMDWLIDDHQAFGTLMNAVPAKLPGHKK